MSHGGGRSCHFLPAVISAVARRKILAARLRTQATLTLTKTTQGWGISSQIFLSLMGNSSKDNSHDDDDVFSFHNKFMVLKEGQKHKQTATYFFDKKTTPPKWRLSYLPNLLLFLLSV
jgi:hypothetical protein